MISCTATLLDFPTKVQECLPSSHHHRDHVGRFWFFCSNDSHGFQEWLECTYQSEEVVLPTVGLLDNALRCDIDQIKLSYGSNLRLVIIDYPVQCWMVQADLTTASIANPRESIVKDGGLR